VDRRVLRKHGALPLRVEDGRLVVAMSDPTNFYALEDLAMLSGHPIKPVVALEDEIRRVFDKAFAIGQEVSDILEEAADDSFVEESTEVELGVDAGPDEAPIVKVVGAILQRAVGEGASDIHVEPRANELTVRLRVDGVLREVMSVPSKLQGGVIARFKILANLDIAERRVPQDGRFSVRSGGQKIDLRAATLPTVFGEKVVLRLLDTSSVEADLTKLGFARRDLDRFEEVYRRPYGTVLVTGPTGSGKSTTLYATLSELNTPEKNIITVEDPVEYRMRGINQIQVNPKAGLTFASGLRSILRADPDIIMIGEIRDYETAKISVEAALTGHLVLATLHTNDAPAAVTRLTDMGVEPFLTASAVDCVIAQRLARRLCEKCKQPAQIERELLEVMGFPFKQLPEGEEPSFYRTVGCDRCGGTGYRGRVGIYELMVVDEQIKEMVLHCASAGKIGRVAEQEGSMVRLREDGLLKAAKGMTTIEEVLRTVV
jgi:type IV pilus assembly protein PilB